MASVRLAPTLLTRAKKVYNVCVFEVRPNLAFQVDIGSQSDVEGINHIRSYEQAGLFVPGIELSLSTKKDQVIKEIWEGNTVRVLYGRKGKLDLFGEYVIVKADVLRQTNYWNVTLIGIHKGIKFSVVGRSRFFEDLSVNAIKSVLSEHFSLKFEAKPTNDRMVWIQPRFYPDKAFVLHLWQHSWYPSNNALLMGIRRDGKAHIVDLDTLAPREDLRVGTLKGYKRHIGNFAMSFFSKDSNFFVNSKVGEWKLKEFQYGEHEHGYQVKLGIKDPESYLLGEKAYVYKFLVSDNAHANYNAAIAKNTEILSKLTSVVYSFMWEVCPDCKSGEVNDSRPPIELFWVLKIAVEEANKRERPKEVANLFPPASGKYIVSAIETIIVPGDPIYQQVYVVRDSFRS